MNESLYKMIFKRKSFHTFRMVPEATISEEEKEKICAAYKEMVPLRSEIKTEIRIVEASETTCQRAEEYCILFYSEAKDGYLQNIGYLGEQLDLYLAAMNIGTLWFGIGKTSLPAIKGMAFVIMMAIRKIDDATKFRKDMFKSKRKPLAEIWQGEPLDGVANIVRFAPSACNTQPWLVASENGLLQVYRYKKAGKRGIMPRDKVSFYNRIDIGIFLCFLELALRHEGISFQRQLFKDNGGDDERVLNAVYRWEKEGWKTNNTQRSSAG